MRGLSERFFMGGDRALRHKVGWMLGGLGLGNLLLWGLAVLAFRHYPLLLGTAFLAYSFGLRHAVDADHIAAIDNVTRKLMQQGERPAGVGFYFSLGHSTIVFLLSGVVAATAFAIKTEFGVLETFGGIVGTLVSGFFLLAIAAMNLIILVGVFKIFQRVRHGGVYVEEDLDLLLSQRGIFGRIFRRLFRLVEQSWQMYFIGLLFGLGFDTATEVGLLGISATEASKGLPVWSIMLFPSLFMAGMALVDTADSLMMLGAYGWAFAKPLRKLYYNITVTSVSILVALVVGGVELLGLVQANLQLSGPVWGPIAALNNHFGMLGYLIIGIFVLSWLVSMLIYRVKGYDRVEIGAAE